MEGDCTLKWEEKSNKVGDLYVQCGAKPNEWFDAYANLPGMGTGMWKKWEKERKRPCPGGETVEISDEPNQSVDESTMVTAFAVTATSAPNCPCAKGGLWIESTAFATQTLEPDGKGGVKVQVLEPGINLDDARSWHNR